MDVLGFKIPKLGAEEEGHFKILRDSKALSIEKLLSDEALFNAGLNQTDPRDEQCGYPSF